MQELLELVALLQRGKPLLPEWKQSVFDTGSKMQQLFDAITQKLIVTEQDALRLLYAQDSDQNGKFSSLKTRLKDRLLLLLPLFDFTTPQLRDRNQAQVEAQKRWSSVLLLTNQRARLNILPLLQEVMEVSTTFDLIDLQVKALHQYCHYYACDFNNLKQYDHFARRYTATQRIWQAENQAESDYQQLLRTYAATPEARRKTGLLAQAAYEQASVAMADSDAYRLHFYGRLLHVTALSYQAKHQEVLDACLSAIDFFGKKPFDCQTAFQTFNYQLIVAAIQTRSFEVGQAAIEAQGSAFPEGHFNWFKFKELAMILALHSRRYDEAFVIGQQACSHPALKQLPESLQQSFKLYEAYLHWLGESGQISHYAPEKPFKLAKFLQEVPVFSADKRGKNIPVLMVQILFAAVRQQKDGLIDRVEALSKYTSRYLKADDQLRSNCFMHILIEWVNAGFHPAATERKTAKYRDKLAATPIEIANQPFELEIIPYEDILEIALQADGNFVK
jgi:hypothetical protein